MREGGDTSEADISRELADKWCKKGIVGDREEVKGKRRVPTEMTWEWEGNESLNQSLRQSCLRQRSVKSVHTHKQGETVKRLLAY